MSRRSLQSLCILLVFLAGIVTVTALGIGQGRKNASVAARGSALDTKIPWETAVHQPPGTLDIDPEKIVYVTATGTKFHLSSRCPYLRRSKSVTGIPYETAARRHLGLCSACKKLMETSDQD